MKRVCAVVRYNVDSGLRWGYLESSSRMDPFREMFSRADVDWWQYC